MKAAVTCASMPIDHDVATAPWTALLPHTAEVDGRVISTSAASTSISGWIGILLFVYDEDHLRRACRDAVTALGDGAAYATKAFLCLAMARSPTKRACTSTRRSAAKCTLPVPPESRRSG